MGGKSQKTPKKRGDRKNKRGPTSAITTCGHTNGKWMNRGAMGGEKRWRKVLINAEVGDVVSCDSRGTSAQAQLCVRKRG